MRAESEALALGGGDEVAMTLLETDAERRSAAAELAELRQALEALRGIRSLSELLERAPTEACRACGFDRAVLCGVRGAEITVESAHFDGDQAGTQEFLRLARSDRSRLHAVLEGQIIRRRSPVLATDVGIGGTGVEPFLSQLPTVAYVAAPIMPEGRVIGIVYADRQSSGRSVDELDRDLLWAFAEGLGYALERSVLLERLRSQRDRIHELMGSAVTAIEQLNDARVELNAPSQQGASLQTAEGLSLAADSGIEDLLTRRELEVLTLMSAGVTNAGIARELVISEYTVKSHVKHILRKLGAANRAEAVSRYLLALRLGRRRRVGRRADDAVASG